MNHKKAPVTMICFTKIHLQVETMRQKFSLPCTFFWKCDFQDSKCDGNVLMKLTEVMDGFHIKEKPSDFRLSNFILLSMFLIVRQTQMLEMPPNWISVLCYNHNSVPVGCNTSVAGSDHS